MLRGPSSSTQNIPQVHVLAPTIIDDPLDQMPSRLTIEDLKRICIKHRILEDEVLLPDLTKERTILHQVILHVIDTCSCPMPCPPFNNLL